MRRTFPGWFAVFVCLASLSPTGCRASRSHEVSSTDNTQVNAVLRAPGTVVSVEAKPHGDQPDDLLPGQRVCYTIDSFFAVPSPQRSAYASAERARLAVNGPRCRDTSIDPAAVQIKVGDPVDIYYTLGNDGQIFIVSVYTQGLEL
jgi:hypothetical protein